MVEQHLLSAPFNCHRIRNSLCERFLARGSLARAGVRTYATVQDTPVRHYGGLKDQDRIFTNIFLRHDHGIKGAKVRSQAWLNSVKQFTLLR